MTTHYRLVDPYRIAEYGVFELRSHSLKDFVAFIDEDIREDACPSVSEELTEAVKALSNEDFAKAAPILKSFELELTIEEGEIPLPPTSKDFVPTTDFIRAQFCIGTDGLSDKKAEEIFDAWLTDLKKTVWEQGYRTAMDGTSSECNPYLPGAAK